MLVALGILLVPNFATADYDYYCPKGNASIIANDRHILGKAIMPFPLAPNELAPRSELVSRQLEWTLMDCSNHEFLCFDAEEPAKHAVRRIFVPRHAKVGMTYHFGPARAFVIGVTSSSKVPTVQVIDSQRLDDRTVAMKLTLRQGKGVVYIDGLNFWDRVDYKNGETCVLESGIGFFSKATVTTVLSGTIE